MRHLDGKQHPPNQPGVNIFKRKRDWFGSLCAIFSAAFGILKFAT